MIGAGDVLHPVDKPLQTVALPAVTVDADLFTPAFRSPIFNVGPDIGGVAPIVVAMCIKLRKVASNGQGAGE